MPGFRSRDWTAPRPTRARIVPGSSDGTLTTQGGLPVLGDGGPIQVPANTAVSIGSDGTVSAKTAPARVRPSASSSSSRRTRRSFAARTDCFAVPTAICQRTSTAQVQDGALEGSNVSPIATMVAMISAARQFESQMKLLSGAEANDKAAGPVAGRQLRTIRHDACPVDSKTGMEAQQTQLDAISNNLAKRVDQRLQAVARGVRGSDVSEPAPVGRQFDRPDHAAHWPAGRVGHRAGGDVAQFRPRQPAAKQQHPGPGRQRHGFLRGADADGTTGYTRDGSFKVNAQGQLVTNNGYTVQPGITIPAKCAKVTVGTDVRSRSCCRRSGRADGGQAAAGPTS